MKYGAVNLGQGFPDWPAPEDIKQKAKDAIDDDHNQYAITWGVKSFRDAIAAKTKWFLGMDIDPETEITVTCGSTEGMIAAVMATIDPGEEAVDIRSVLRELHAGHDHLRCHARDLCRCIERMMDLYSIAMSSRRVQRKDKGDHHLQSEQPDRKSFHARRDGIHRRTLQRVRRSLLHRRDLRAHPTSATDGCSEPRRISAWPPSMGCVNALSSSIRYRKRTR